MTHPLAPTGRSGSFSPPSVVMPPPLLKGIGTAPRASRLAKRLAPHAALLFLAVLCLTVLAAMSSLYVYMEVLHRGCGADGCLSDRYNAALDSMWPYYLLLGSLVSAIFGASVSLLALATARISHQRRVRTAGQRLEGLFDRMKQLYGEGRVPRERVEQVRERMEAARSSGPPSEQDRLVGQWLTRTGAFMLPVAIGLCVLLAVLGWLAAANANSPAPWYWHIAPWLALSILSGWLIAWGERIRRAGTEQAEAESEALHQEEMWMLEQAHRAPAR